MTTYSAELGTGSLDEASRNHLRCFNCHEFGHVSQACPKPKMIICYNCRKEGHKTFECPAGKRCHFCQQEGHIARDCVMASISTNSSKSEWVGSADQRTDQVVQTSPKGALSSHSSASPAARFPDRVVQLHGRMREVAPAVASSLYVSSPSLESDSASISRGERGDALTRFDAAYYFDRLAYAPPLLQPLSPPSSTPSWPTMEGTIRNQPGGERLNPVSSELFAPFGRRSGPFGAESETLGPQAGTPRTHNAMVVPNSALYPNQVHEMNRTLPEQVPWKVFPLFAQPDLDVDLSNLDSLVFAGGVQSSATESAFSPSVETSVNAPQHSGSWSRHVCCDACIQTPGCTCGCVTCPFGAVKLGQTAVRCGSMESTEIGGLRDMSEQTMSSLKSKKETATKTLHNGGPILGIQQEAQADRERREPYLSPRRRRGSDSLKDDLLMLASLQSTLPSTASSAPSCQAGSPGATSKSSDRAGSDTSGPSSSKSSHDQGASSASGTAMISAMPTDIPIEPSPIVSNPHVLHNHHHEHRTRLLYRCPYSGQLSHVMVVHPTSGYLAHRHPVVPGNPICTIGHPLPSPTNGVAVGASAGLHPSVYQHYWNHHPVLYSCPHVPVVERPLGNATGCAGTAAPDQRFSFEPTVPRICASEQSAVLDRGASGSCLRDSASWAAVDLMEKSILVLLAEVRDLKEHIGATPASAPPQHREVDSMSGTVTRPTSADDLEAGLIGQPLGSPTSNNSVSTPLKSETSSVRLGASRHAYASGANPVTHSPVANSVPERSKTGVNPCSQRACDCCYVCNLNRKLGHHECGCVCEKCSCVPTEFSAKKRCCRVRNAPKDQCQTPDTEKAVTVTALERSCDSIDHDKCRESRPVDLSAVCPVCPPTDTSRCCSEVAGIAAADCSSCTPYCSEAVAKLVDVCCTAIPFGSSAAMPCSDASALPCSIVCEDAIKRRTGSGRQNGRPRSLSCSACEALNYSRQAIPSVSCCTMDVKAIAAESATSRDNVPSAACNFVTACVDRAS